MRIRFHTASRLDVSLVCISSSRANRRRCSWWSFKITSTMSNGDPFAGQVRNNPYPQRAHLPPPATRRNTIPSAFPAKNHGCGPPAGYVFAETLIRTTQGGRDMDALPLAVLLLIFAGAAAVI